MIVFALIYVVSVVSGGLFASDVTARADNTEAAAKVAEATATLVRVLILTGGGLFFFMTAMGGLLRILGWLRCILVPAGTGAKGPAFLCLVCELAVLGSFGFLSFLLFQEGNVEQGLDRLLVLILTLLGSTTPAFAIPWLPLLVMVAAGLLGLVFLLLFARQIAGALQSKELPKRLKNFILWLVFAGLVAGVAIGTREYLARALAKQIEADPRLARYSWQFEAYRYSYYVTLLIYVILLLIVLMKYLGLLGLGSDEAQRRAGKWRPV